MPSSTTEGDMVKYHHHPQRAAVCKSVMIALLATACLFIGLSIGHAGQQHENKNYLAPEQIEVETILPSLQVDIVRDDENHVQGTMAVLADPSEYFVFQSQRGEITGSTIQFQCDKTKASKAKEMGGWCGFDMTMTGDDKKITLFRYDGTDDIVIVLPQEEDGQLGTADISAMQSFIGSKVAEYYVALTFKLAAMGKTGADGHVAYAQLHGEAQWIFTTAVQDESVTVQWDLGHRRLGLHHETSTIVEDLNRRLLGDDATDDIMMDTASLMQSGADGLEWLDVEDHQGRFLGSCGQPYSRCGNNCYGMCGPSCTCWSWACGGCGCYDSCRSHDYYCSCQGLWHPYCIAAVWALIC